MARQLSYTKKYSFRSMGSEWTDCYVEYRPFNYDSLKEVAEIEKDQSKSIEIFMGILKERFVGGQVIVDGQKVPMEADDLVNLPVEEITNLIKDATGNLDQASSEK